MSVQTAVARVKSIRTSPRKLNLVAALIRNMSVAEALAQLTFCSKKVAVDVKKCLQAAIANAENNFNMNVDNLYVQEATVGKAFVMKRFRARARGRGMRILKPFSNLLIKVVELEN